MSEILIDLRSLPLVELLGVNDLNLNYIKSVNPKLKIISRGNQMKVVGDSENLEAFEIKMDRFLDFFEKYGRIKQDDIETIFVSEGIDKNMLLIPGDVLVHGNGGKSIKALTPNQQVLVQNVLEKDMVFAIGPAGSGKTYTAVALAVRALKNKEIKRLILTRPAVEAGENLGFLPGDLKDKLDPYLQPLYDALKDMIPAQRLQKLMEDRTIEIAPLAFMRGRTLDHAFVILDEAQNATDRQMKMFLTRMGKAAKFVITGDITQIDLPRNQNSGLLQAEKILSHIPEIGFVHLGKEDVVRHKIVGKILKAYEDKA